MNRTMDAGSEGERDKVTKMENEIEKKYLIAKLDELIKQVNQSDQKTIPSQIVGLPSKFHRLKTTIQQAPNNTKLTKEQLYNLNNLLSERPSKQTSFFSPEWLKFAIALEDFLKELTPKKTLLKEFSHGDTSRSDHGSVPLQSEDEAQTHGLNDSCPHVKTPLGGQSEDETRQDDVVEVYKWSNQYVDEKNVYGTKDKEVFLRRLILPLEEHKNSLVFRGFGLVGMRGIGKTTLAQMVFNHPDIKIHYLPRVWVCMSKQPGDDPDPRNEIVKRALRSLGVEDEIITYAGQKHQLKGLLYTLRQQLLGRRYLIVLDDACIEEKYYNFVSNLEKNVVNCEETMAYGLPKECGGAVIVTSRNKEIAGKIVGEENLHRVLPLSGESCWEIFKNTINEEGDLVSKDRENMEKLRKKITEKCHGLPLTAKKMGEIARKSKLITTRKK